jgi:DNA-binding PadR family transcriptional regulator
LRLRGVDRFHGFMIASEIAEREAARRLTAHGTLYRALDRMDKAGLLQSAWEDPSAAAIAERPRRRFYWVTAAGQEALAQARSRVQVASIPLRGGATP